MELRWGYHRGDEIKRISKVGFAFGAPSLVQKSVAFVTKVFGMRKVLLVHLVDFLVDDLDLRGTIVVRVWNGILGVPSGLEHCIMLSLNP